jgi:hypothetical protein
MNLIVRPRDVFVPLIVAFATTLGAAPVVLAQRAAPEPDPRTVVEPQLGTLPEPDVITKAVDSFDRRVGRRSEPKDGFYVELGNMITGAGWISAGPGYRRHVLNDKAMVSFSGAMSVRYYRMAQATLEFPHLAANHLRFGIQDLYRDALQVNYFGLGNDSSLAARSGYRLQYNDATTYAALGGRGIWLQARAGLLQPLSVGAMRGREAPYPDTIALFSDRDAPGISNQPSFVHGELSLSVDTRDYPGHPTRGGFYELTTTAFVDEKTHRDTFMRYEGEISQFVGLHSPTLILALHGLAVMSDTSPSHSVPFYLMPNLGGRNLRGFTDFRFYNRNLQSYSVETRWRMFSHVDLAAFVDAGSVAPTAGQLKFSDLKPSYGAGIRLHNNRATMARLDAGHGAEGWHLFFKLNEPFRRSAQSNGWRSVAPFVP